MEVKARDLILFLNLEKEYEEFKEVMDEFLEKVEQAGYDRDFFIYKLRKEFEKEKRIILVVFMEMYEKES